MSTSPNRLERRGAQRFEVHQPLTIHFDGRTVSGFIQDLSSRGIFLYAEAELRQGAMVELTFTMPSEITLGENMPVRCRGRVSRAVPGGDGHRNGIAVQLYSYDYLPPDASTLHFVRVSTPSPAGAVPR